MGICREGHCSGKHLSAHSLPLHVDIGVNVCGAPCSLNLSQDAPHAKVLETRVMVKTPVLMFILSTTTYVRLSQLIVDNACKAVENDNTAYIALDQLFDIVQADLNYRRMTTGARDPGRRWTSIGCGHTSWTLRHRAGSVQ